MSSPRPGQSCGRRGRVGWGRSCCPHPPSGYGTERIGSGASLGNHGGTGAIAMMVLSVISMYSYLEKVGTLLVVACEDTSAVCMMNNLGLQPIGPPPILALSQRCCCAYTALSADQTSQSSNPRTVGCSRVPSLRVRELNGLWDLVGKRVMADDVRTVSGKRTLVDIHCEVGGV